MGCHITSAYRDPRGDWFAGSLHNHTLSSTHGPTSPLAAVAQARQAGLAFLALTDHDRRLAERRWTQDDWAQATARPGLLLLKGYEASYPQDHVNCLGVMPQDVALQPGDAGFPAAVEAAGGLAWLNHPYRWLNEPSRLLQEPALEGLLGLEVYSGARVLRRTAEGASEAVATALWDVLLSAGRRVWALASGDCHAWRPELPQWVGNGLIVAALEALSTEALFASLRHGAFYATTGPCIEAVEVTDRKYCVRAPWAEMIRFIGEGGRVLAERREAVACYPFRGDERYVRAEVVGARAAWPGQELVRETAWLQPAFVE